MVYDSVRTLKSYRKTILINRISCASQPQGCLLYPFNQTYVPESEVILMKNAALYIRSNNYHTCEGFRQQSSLFEFCDLHRLRPVQVYYDRDCSGLTLMRPSLQRLLGNLDDQIFEAVVIESLDRLTRNSRDLPVLLRTFREKQIDLKIMKGDLSCELPFIRG